MVSGYRGEVRPRRQGVTHHIVMSAAAHQTGKPSDPFPPLSSKQFPSLYTRSPVKNMYRQYMHSKSAYKKGP